MIKILQVHWASSRLELPAQHPDVYKDYPSFLWAVGELYKSRQKKGLDRDGLAVNFIRKEGRECFGGVGVYTINELFYIAGRCLIASNFKSPFHVLYARRNFCLLN